MLALMLLATAVEVTLGGVLLPKTSRPVSLSYNNSNFPSDYSFRFQLATMTRADSTLRITFPPDYIPGLGVSTCAAETEKGTAYPCTVANTVVAVTVGQLFSSPVENLYTVVVKGVVNPAHTGATGWFRLETYAGVNLLDYNDLFAQVGITAAPASIQTANVNCYGSCLSGATAALQVSFLPVADLAAGHRIRIQFPSGLTLVDPPPCISAQLPSAQCSQQRANSVFITSLTTTVAKGTSIVFYFSNVGLGSYSGYIGNFDIFVLEADSNNLTQVKTGANGPVSAPGAVYGIAICPNGVNPCSAADPTVSLGNTAKMTITASTTNNISSAGAVVVTFPSSFGSFVAGTCMVLSGFKNKPSATLLDQLSCVTNSAQRTITISNFADFVRGQFSVAVRVTVPSSSGLTPAFTISTYQDTALTKLIDIDQTATTGVSTLAQPSKLQLSWSSATQSAGSSQSLKLVLRPNSAIPAPLTAYRVKVQFPVGFQLLGTLDVWLRPNSYFTDMQLTGASWDAVSCVLDMPLIAGPASIPTGLDSIFDINNGGSQFLLPSTPGDYYLQVSIANGATDIETSSVWISISAPALSTFTVTSLSRDINKKTLYKVTLSPSVAIPASAVSSDITVPWGLIEIQFPTVSGSLNPLYLADLGSGQSSVSAVSCRVHSGLSGSVSCWLSPTAATLQILGFQPVPIGASVVIDFADIGNAQTSGVAASLTATAYSVVQQTRVPVNTATAALTQSFYFNGSVTLPKVNGRSPYPGGDGKNSVTFTPNKVNSVASCSFVLWLEGAVAAGAGSAVIMKFPSGYPLPSSGVTCWLQYTVAQTCYTFPGAGWIVFPTVVQPLSAYTEYPVMVLGLTNPASRIDSSSLSIVIINSYIEAEYVYFAPFSPFALGAVASVSLVASSYKAGDYDVAYTFIFAPGDPIPAGGKIVLTFPKDSYALLTSPAVSCSVSGAQSSSGIVCTPASNTIAVSGFSAYSPGLPIYIKVLHVLNPSQTGTTAPFSIETMTSSGLLIGAAYDIAGVTVVPSTGLGQLSHTEFYSDPSNGKVTTALVVTFRPAVNYPRNTILKVTYPSEFSQQSVTPTCVLSGGMTTVQSASWAYGVATIVTDTEFQRTDSTAGVTVTLAGVKNISPGATSGMVRIDAYYSGALIDSSSLDSQNRTFRSDYSPGIGYIDSFEQSVLTASEPSQYQFSIFVSANFSSECTVNIEFPSAFPRGLGEVLACRAPELSIFANSTVQCWAKERVLVVAGTKGWTAGDKRRFNVTVERVLNPGVKAAQGNFKMYTKCGTRILDYGESLGPASPSTYASNMLFTSTNISNPVQGFTSVLGVLAKTESGFQSAMEDAAFVDFPKQYDMTFSGPVMTCKSDLSAYTTCSYSANRLSISAFSSLLDTSTKTAYSFLLSGLENPYAPGDLPHLSLSLYRNSTKSVLYKTFPNLNIPPSFTFSQPGATLLVNYDREWTVARGTMTDPMYMSMDASTPYNFTVSVSNAIPFVTLVPTVISWSIGDSYQTFRIAVGRNATEGRYYIEWKLVGNTALAPVRRAWFTVTSEYYEIRVSQVTHVPHGGRSSPVLVSLPKAPDAPLTVKVVKLGALPTLMKFDPEVLNFDAGTLIQSFRIQVDSESSGSQGEFYLYKDGASEDAYRFSMDTFRFIVSGRDLEPPAVIGVRVLELGRNAVSLTIEMSEDCTIYSVLALWGSPAPSISQLQYSSYPFALLYNATSDSMVPDRYVYPLRFENLTAQMKYSVYFCALDLGLNAAGTVKNITVQTNDRFPMAGFRLKLKVGVLGDGFKSTLISRISEVLALKPSLLGFIDPSFLVFPDASASDSPLSTTSSGRSLIASLYASMVVYPDPSQPIDVTPLDYVNYLNARKFKLREVLPELDITASIIGVEVRNDPPAWKSEPSAVLDIANNLRVTNLQLASPGTVYICVLQDASSRPTSWQVVHGLDSENSACMVTATVSVAAGEIQTCMISTLEEDHEYWVYVSATNALPRYPALMLDGDVSVIGFKVFPLTRLSACSVLTLLAATLFL